MTAPIVLLHPLGADRRFWDPVRKELAHRPVEAFDLPGHGGAPVLHAGAGIEEYSATVEQLLAESLEPVHLVGLSLGGLIVQWIAAVRPDLLASAVLVDTVPVYPEAMQQMWRDRAAAARGGRLGSLIEPMVTMWFTEDLVGADDMRVTQARNTFSATDAEGYARACDLLAAVDLRDLRHDTAPPTFVVCGEDDAEPFRAAATWLAKTTGDGTVFWMPGKHACAVEFPDRFAALLGDLLPD
ncbi:alpha/beta fold hydrolase [Mycolicibacterium sp. S2-37]|uniref:alpha/beta fold hydrolase n=1 Tax=Mycolicibacterium sp. S2-37 TaxID=2810297 RepID=UPI001A94CC39|nr:alpha/beta fold hydrolase [Mycolicibacterium sp. S2-37]MBO0678644.1 alpha/beta fold hydrolase [Mycolicibacterium sp. S2-37]